jgi:hypothetical protein
MKLISVFFLFSFLLISGILNRMMAQTGQLTSFDSLTSALFAGKDVRVVIQYQKCRMTGEGAEKEKPKNAVTGMAIDTYEYFGEGFRPGSKPFLSFSESKLIRNPLGKGYVINYGKVKVLSNDSVTITAQYLKPGRHKVLMDATFRGKINNGKNDGGVWFYTGN